MRTAALGLFCAVVAVGAATAGRVRLGAPAGTVNLQDVVEITKNQQAVDAKQAETQANLDEATQALNEATVQIADAQQAHAREVQLGGLKNAKLEQLKKVAKATVDRLRNRQRCCLERIRGGKDRIYWQLRKLFAAHPPQDACPLLKEFPFPELTKHGHNERIVGKYHIVAPVSLAGDEITTFSAAKADLFRCMCEDTSGGCAAGKCPCVAHDSKKFDKTIEDATKQAKTVEQQQETMVAMTTELAAALPAKERSEVLDSISEN